MESNWEISNIDTLSGEMCGTVWDGILDFQIMYRSLWDNDHLYFFFEVHDDCLVTNFNSVVPWFENDLVELFFSDSRKIKGSNITQLAIVYGLDSVYYPGTNKIRSGILCEILETKKGYNIEMLIPWEGIEIIPEIGKSILFNAEGSDCDLISKEPGVFYGRDISISWSPKSCRKTWRNTNNIGSLILSE